MNADLRRAQRCVDMTTEKAILNRFAFSFFSPLFPITFFSAGT
jgi:hypothetical protein